MIFGSTIGTKINGHKVNTQAHGVKNISAPKFIYIPVKLFMGAESTALVKRGDHVKIGQKVAELLKPFYVPTFSSVSGKVVDFEDRQNGKGDLVKHIVIENNFKETTTKEIKQISYASDSVTIVNAIKEAGIVGMGGAGFPMYVKYMNCSGIDTILVNAIECEPFLTCDKFTILDSNNIIKLFEGALLARKAADAKNIVIAVKKTNKIVIQALEIALANWTHDDKNSITIIGAKNKYPMGWERTLVRHLFKVEYDRFPAEVGIVVSNVQTIIAMRDALLDGEVVTSRHATVAGDAIKTERTCLVRLYTPLSHIVEELGGYKFDDIQISAGGPMMGGAPTSDKFAITAASSGAVIQQAVEYIELPCLRCGSCTDHCPAGLQPVQIKDALKMADFDRLELLDADKCIGCGLCSFICPSRISLTPKMDIAKNVVINKKKKK